MVRKPFFKRLLEDKVITIERNMNYDGKTFFFRFPKELTKDLHKDDLVDIIDICVN